MSAQVTVIELSTQTPATHGYRNDHVWVEANFGTGNDVTIRLDDDGSGKVKVYLSLNEEVGQDVILIPEGGVSPHGKPWRSMNDEELREAQGWCMIPEDHDNLSRELDRRRKIREGA